MRRSFTTRTFVLHFIVIALPLFIDSLYLFLKYYNASIEQARKNLVEAATFRAQTFDELSPVPDHFLEDMAHFLNISEGNIPAVQHTFNDMAKIPYLGQTLFTLNTIDKEKKEFPIVAATDEQLVGLKMHNNPVLETIVKQGEGGSVHYFDFEMRGEVGVFFTKGLLIKEREVPIAILYSLIPREKQLAEYMKHTPSADIDYAIVGSLGVIIESSIPGFKGQYLYPLTEAQKKGLKDSNLFGGLDLASRPLKVLDSPEQFVDFEYEDREYLGYIANIVSLDNAELIAFAPKEQYYSHAASHFIALSITYGVVIIAGIIFAYFLALWFSRPLRQLNVAMEKVSAGDLTQRFFPQPFGCEINIIGTLYNETLETLLNNMKHAEDEHVERQKYQKEIELGRRVQENLLSAEMPQIDQVNTAAIYLPARDVGGDFYCIEEVKSGGLWFAVGDASGKGISSCLYALSARSLMRTYASMNSAVEEICSKANDDFLKNAGDSGMFVTALSGIYSPETSMLSYYSCGHVPGLIRRFDGTLVELSHSGMALGLLPSQGYMADQVQLHKGDIVIFYTKGLTEGVNTRNQFFSLRKVKELLQHRKWQTATEVVDGLVHEFEEFTMGVEQEDEVVIIALEIV